MNIELAKLGNLLYVYCPWAYQPLYSAYKALADRAERRLMSNIIRPGMVVADIGANIGVYSKFFAHLVDPTGSVYAFEPEPKNFARLRRASESRPNVRAVHAAVGSQSGTLKLYVSNDLNVDHHTYDDGEGRRAIEVPVVQLDTFFPPGSRLDFIKMDIQGYEYAALQGARRLLSENHDVKLLLEYWPYGLLRAGCDAAALLRYLRDLGFILVAPGAAREPETLGMGVNDYTNIYAYRP
jgi:FkbM family methyltransferase